MTSKENEIAVTLPPTERITLKRRKLLKEIPTSNTLREASIKANYAPNSNKPYSKGMKRYIEKSLQAMGYTEEAIKNEFERLSNLSESKNDFSNAMRGKENIARMCGYFKDKQEITTKNAVNPTQSSEDMLKEIKSRLGDKLAPEKRIVP